MPLLGYVRLNSSSVLCDCYLKWLPRWLNETGVRGCDEATCAHPENLKGRSIMQVPYESYTCDDFPKPYILQQPETQITLKVWTSTRMGSAIKSGLMAGDQRRSVVV